MPFAASVQCTRCATRPRSASIAIVVVELDIGVAAQELHALGAASVTPDELHVSASIAVPTRAPPSQIV